VLALLSIWALETGLEDLGLDLVVVMVAYLRYMINGDVRKAINKSILLYLLSSPCIAQII
jgi:hypothetical protein